MKKIVYSLMLAIAFLAGCQKESFVEQPRPEDGLPAKITLSIDVPVDEDIVVTKGINDYESEVTELALLLYETGSGRFEFLDLSNSLTSVSTTSLGGRLYSLKADVETLSGEYRMFAIANWSSPFCNLDLLGMYNEGKLADMDFVIESLNAVNSSFVYDVSGNQRFPMSYAPDETVKIYPLSETDDAANKLILKLIRLTSHIEFNFVNGQSEVLDEEGKVLGNENPQFTPQSFVVYNIPNRSDVFYNGDIKSTAYGNKTGMSIAGTTFDFFMLENLQSAKRPCTAYTDRDKWNDENADKVVSPEDKVFTNAPDKGTFVVIKGDYNGTSYFGQVSYTIHLGDFSEGDFGNFNVNRNEHQKYTVTVNGAKSIAVEAEGGQSGGGDVPGAEGVLTQKAANQFVLDAHYETAMLKFNLSLCNTASMIVQTPFTPMTEYNLIATADTPADDYVGADYKWVKFMAPVESSGSFVFPEFDESKSVDIVTLATQLHNANNNNAPADPAYALKDGVVYVAAFVDEYYYDGTNGFNVEKDWTTFANKDNRILILNPSVNISQDQNNTIYPTYVFSISQRSIKTTYAMNPSIDAFGIETWDETGLLKWGTTVNGLDMYNGYANTKLLAEGNTAEIDFTSIGYLTEVTDNSKEAHLYGADSNSDGVLDSPVVSNAVYACLSRNRDTDQNGRIEGDELKWYIPSLQQYQIIWLGQDLLTDDTKLYDKTDLSSLTRNNMDRQGQLFTSSIDGQRLYWPDQGASYSVIADWNYKTKDGAQIAVYNIRCVRNLTATADGLTSSPSTREGNVIMVDGVQNLRSQYMVGEYGQHFERDAENYLPHAFEVCEEDDPANLPILNHGTETIDNNYFTVITNLSTACSEYSQEGDVDGDGVADDLGEWRVPNQRELMLLVQHGLIQGNIYPTRYQFASSTLFTPYNSVGRTLPFVFDVADNGETNANITLPSGIIGPYVARCVRDKQTTSSSSQTGTDYTYGGSVL